MTPNELHDQIVQIDNTIVDVLHKLPLILQSVNQEIGHAISSEDYFSPSGWTMWLEGMWKHLGELETDLKKYVSRSNHLMERKKV